MVALMPTGMVQPAGDQDPKQGLWGAFCKAHGITKASVPLFAADAAGMVEVFPYGRDGRPMLRRSAAMEEMVVSAVGNVLSVPSAEAEGIIYMMLMLDGGKRVVPLYIGKAGRHGRSGAEVSANIAAIHNNGGKFARWGYNYAYHIGDLSAAALPGHAPDKIAPKYRRWAARLFQNTPSTRPQLRMPVRFWCAPWGPASIGIWREFGSCSLAFIEYLLIGVAGVLFPDALLNDEGVNRRATEPQV